MKNFTFNLDIGSNYTICYITEYNRSVNNIPKISLINRINCIGIKTGVVIDILETENTIRSLIKETEKQLGFKIKDLNVEIRGEHIDTNLPGYGSLSIKRKNKEITLCDIKYILEKINPKDVPSNCFIIDKYVQEFAINGIRGISDPLGMEANYLEVFVNLVTASQVQINNITKAITRAGYRVNSIHYSLLSVADSVLTKEEKKQGCLLIDLDEQLTGVIVYSGGSIKFIKEFPIGTSNIVREISKSLHIPFNKVNIYDNNTDEKYKLIIENGLKDIIKIIDDEIRRLGYYKFLSQGGVILTGEGANLEGIKDIVNHIFNMPVKTGFLSNIVGNIPVLS